MKKKFALYAIGGIFAFVLLCTIFMWVDEGLRHVGVLPTKTPVPTSTPTLTPTITPIPTDTPIPTPTSYAVIQNSANARRGPGVDYTISVSLSSGDIHPIVGKNESHDPEFVWYYIRLDNGTLAWVREDLINYFGESKIIEAPPTSTPTSTPKPSPTPVSYAPSKQDLFHNIDGHFGKFYIFTVTVIQQFEGGYLARTDDDMMIMFSDCIGRMMEDSRYNVTGMVFKWDPYETAIGGTNQFLMIMPDC